MTRLLLLSYVALGRPSKKVFGVWYDSVEPSGEFVSYESRCSKPPEISQNLLDTARHGKTRETGLISTVPEGLHPSGGPIGISPGPRDRIFAPISGLGPLETGRGPGPETGAPDEDGIIPDVGGPPMLPSDNGSPRG